MLLRISSTILVLGVLLANVAAASPFDDMTAEEIFSHPEFTANGYSLSSATNSGDVDAPRIYEWVGYIPVGDKRVYFTSYGEPLTCVKWEMTGEWVPEWVVDTLDCLVDSEIIRMDLVSFPHPAETQEE